MPKLTTVLFDLDGTLIDSIGLILDSYKHTARVHNLSPRSDQDWRGGIGTPLSVQFAEWAARPGIDVLIATYREYNLANHDNCVLPYAGIGAMIRDVRGAGLRTGLVTSKNHSGAERGLRVCGLEGTMEVIVGSDDVEHPKPHPEPILKALAQLGATPDSALYVGDSVHDMESGRSAGVRTAAVLWGPFGREDLLRTAPDYWLEHPSQLLPILEPAAPS